MAFGQIDYKQQNWVEEIRNYLTRVKDEYLPIGKTCRTCVSTPAVIGELSNRMAFRDGNFLVRFFDDMSACIHENMHLLANTEIGCYMSCSDGFIENEDCYNLLARTALSAADIELGYAAPKSELIHWMRYMFMSNAN